MLLRICQKSDSGKRLLILLYLSVPVAHLKGANIANCVDSFCFFVFWPLYQSKRRMVYIWLSVLTFSGTISRILKVGFFFSFWHTVAALEIHCHNKSGFISVTSSSLTPSVEVHRLKPLSGTRLVPIEAGVKFGHQRPYFYWKMHELEKKRNLAFRFKYALTELVVVNSKQNTILHVNWASLMWKLLIHSIARSLKSVWCGMDIWPVGGKLFDIPKCCIPFLMYFSKEN